MGRLVVFRGREGCDVAYMEASARAKHVLAAAREVLAREGVARTTLRAVAAEGEVSLGTVQYVYASKELLLRAVIEDVVGEIAGLLRESVQLEGGLAHAIRYGLTTFWSQLVEGQTELQLMQYELTTYALRTPGQEPLARWQYERYAGVVAEWCQEAANNAGEVCAIPFARLARVLLASVDGLILQHVCDPNPTRSREDLDLVIDMLLSLAQPQVAGQRTRD